MRRVLVVPCRDQLYFPGPQRFSTFRGGSDNGGIKGPAVVSTGWSWDKSRIAVLTRRLVKARSGPQSPRFKTRQHLNSAQDLSFLERPSRIHPGLKRDAPIVALVEAGSPPLPIQAGCSVRERPSRAEPRLFPVPRSGVGAGGSKCAVGRAELFVPITTCGCTSYCSTC
jgi:hypothetical protein